MQVCVGVHAHFECRNLKRKRPARRTSVTAGDGSEQVSYVPGSENELEPPKAHKTSMQIKNWRIEKNSHTPVSQCHSRSLYSCFAAALDST